MTLQENELIKIRRDLHQIPEIGLEEYETSDYLLKIINGLPQENLEIKRWKTAILVHLNGENKNYTIGYRTDIDGLPVEEKQVCHFHQSMRGECMHVDTIFI